MTSRKFTLTASQSIALGYVRNRDARHAEHVARIAGEIEQAEAALAKLEEQRLVEQKGYLDELAEELGPAASLMPRSLGGLAFDMADGRQVISYEEPAPALDPVAEAVMGRLLAERDQQAEVREALAAQE